MEGKEEGEGDEEEGGQGPTAHKNWSYEIMLECSQLWGVQGICSIY